MRKSFLNLLVVGLWLTVVWAATAVAAEGTPQRGASESSVRTTILHCSGDVLCS